MLLGKNIVKGATQVRGHSFKLHFCMFEISQVKHNSLNCHNELLECFQLIIKFTCQNLTQINFFFMFKTLKPWEWIILGFFQTSFFLPNVYHSFWKLERILTLMIRRTKGFELMIFFIIINLNTFGFDLVTYGFWNVLLTKVVHVYMIEGMNS